MNNLLKSAALLLAGFGFAACSSEVTEPSAPAFKGDKAYLAVSIQYANGTRALGDKENDFANANDAEKYIKDVQCYFYSETGEFILKAPLTPIVEEATDEAPSVHFNLKQTVVLEDLKEKGSPRLMTVVINEPADLKGMSLSAAQLTLQTKINEVAEYTDAANNTVNGITNFVMSSTTYDENATTCCCAVELTADNFLEQAPTKDEDLDNKAVKVYVERVAAKVSADIVGLTAVATNADGEEEVYSIYKIENDPTNPFLVDGEPRDLYVKVSGWALNVLAKNYYPYKKITKGANYFDTWSVGALHRSYWGESPLWSVTTGFADSVEDQAATYADNDGQATAVDYISYNDLKNAMGGVEYCRPNTNTKEALAHHYTNRATNVLVKAVVMQEDGTGGYEPALLCRYAGMLYTQDNFVNLIVNNANAAGLNLYTLGEDDKYHNCSPADVEFYNAYDGKAGLQLKTAEGWYSRHEPGVGETPSEDGYVYDAIAKENVDLKPFTTTDAENNIVQILAQVYKDGMMYYTIPVEHNLAAGDNTYLTQNYTALKDGDYGIVRNHAYQLSINSITRLGKSVFDPYEDIVPNDEDNQLYYVGARIYVLAWKTVTQNVAL